MPQEKRGHIMLQGGNEFNGRMADADRKALALCGGNHAPVVIVPTAAAPDSNHERSGGIGVRWFRSLGATSVKTVPLIDAASSRDPAIADTLKRAALIYILGGFPGHLADTLSGSAAWWAMKAAHSNGAVLGGSSAGAMVLCDHYFDPGMGRIRTGLGLLSDCAVVPHHDTFGAQWVTLFKEQLPGATLIGIDEVTGIIGSGSGSVWTVYGKGRATIYAEDNCRRYQEGVPFQL